MHHRCAWIAPQVVSGAQETPTASATIPHIGTTSPTEASAPDQETGESLVSVLVALTVNVLLATGKGIAAALTGSSALFAETLHTVADAGNEVFLWIAVRRSRRPPDASHPFGYGPERWFYALLAAIGTFVVGGVVSIYEGVRALLDPTELEAFWVGASVLVASILLDGTSRLVAVRNLRTQARRRGISLRQLLDEASDPTITTVYLEDTVDVLGAVLALVSLVLHRITGSAAPDAVATILIGLLLGYVAVRLARRNRRLLSNQSVPARYVASVCSTLQARPEVLGVPSLQAVYLGPGEVLVAADVVLADGVDVPERLARIRDELQEVPAIAHVHLTPVPGPAVSPQSTAPRPGAA